MILKDGLVYVVNGVKQASAFPPNFIHSLDATHMMLTALECRVCSFPLRFFLNTMELTDLLFRTET